MFFLIRELNTKMTNDYWWNYIYSIQFKLFFKPTLHQASLTFIVGEAIVEALRSIRRCGAVEGVHRKGAGWWSLCPMIYQYLFCKSKFNHKTCKLFWAQQILPFCLA